MGRGRRSGEQRNQATSGYELKKKRRRRRSRTGKGMNFPWSLGPSCRDGGSSPARGGGCSSPVAGGRRAGVAVTAWGYGARRGRAGSAGIAGLGVGGRAICDSVIGLGRIHKG